MLRSLPAFIAIRSLKSLVTQLLIALLIVNPVLAAKPELPRPLPEKSPLDLASSWPAPLSAYAAFVQADSRMVSKAIQGGNAALKLRKNGLGEIAAPSLGLLVDVFKADPNGSSLSIAQMSQLFRRARNQALSANTQDARDAFRAGIRVAGSIQSALKNGDVSVGALASIEAIEQQITDDGVLNPNQTNLVAQPLKYANIEAKADSYVTLKMSEAHELAQTNSKFKAVVDLSFGDLFNASVTDDANTVIQKNSQDVPESVKALVNTDSTVSVSTTIIENSYRNECTTVHNITTVVITEVSAIPTKPVAKPDEKKLTEEEKKYQDRENKINKASQAINFLSKLVADKINPEYGRKMQVIGDAAVKVARAFNEYKKVQDKIFNGDVGKFLKLGSLFTANAQNLIGSAVLAGNVIGIALAAFKLFKGVSGGPTPEQMILEQIQALRKEVQQMRQEMHERFDLIDMKLNKLFETVDARFDSVDRSLDSIRLELVGLHEDLNRLEGNIYTWIEEVGRRDLKKNMALGIGYRATTGLDMPYSPNYTDYAAFFHLWATDFAKDQVQAGLLERNYTDAKAYDELNNFPLDTNINYLAQFPARNLGLEPLASDRLVNPRDWQIASAAYLQLAHEWPQHARRYSPDKLKEIYLAGQRAQTAVENITTLNTSQGKKPNRRLFDALVAKYRGKADVLGQAIKKVESDYKNDPANKAVKEVNIWSDANQITSRDWGTPFNPCNNESCGLADPNNLVSLTNVAPRAFLTAEKMGLGKFDYCTQFLFVRPQNANTVTVDIYFKLYLTFNNQQVNYAWLNHCACDVLPLNTDPNTIVDRWNNSPWNWKQKFEANAKLSTSPNFAVLTNEVFAKVTQELQKHRQLLTQKIFDEFSRAGSIQTAARELSGAKKLLDAYIALGMPRSLETNDYLRSLLYGNDPVPDENGIKQLYEKALADLNANKTIARPDLATITTPRINELSIVLNAILGEIQQYHQQRAADPVFYNYPQALDTVGGTLQSLETHNTEATLGKYLVAHPQALSFAANTAQEITLTATDSAGAMLNYSIVSQPSHGTFSGTVPNLIYTPTTNYVGPDSFSFKVNNGMADSNIALISLNLAGGAACSALTLLPPKTLTTGAKPFAVVTGLFNNDRFPDLAVSNFGAGNVSIFLGNGSGDFTKPTIADYPTGQQPAFLVTGDFNGDRLTDIAVPNQLSSTVSILLGNGSGGFSKAPDVRVGLNPTALAVGDYNGDNRLDLAVADAADNNTGNNFFILTGNGAGGFTIGASLKLNPRPRSVSAADFNRDGKLDVVVANFNAGELTVLLGNGSGAFPQTRNLSSVANPGYLAIDDFNQDGVKDIAVTSLDADQQVAVLFGAEAGNFEGTANYNLNLKPGAVVSRDFNLDGRLDLAIAPEPGNSLTILASDELGIFSEAGSVNGAFEAYALASDDFNQDGKPDLAVPNFNGISISIILNTTCKPTVTAPQTLAVVSAASYRGLRTAANAIVAGFGDGVATGVQVASSLPLPTTLAGTTVKVKDSTGAEIPAPLFFVSPGQLNFLIPERAALGEATITASSGNGKVSLGTVQIDRIAPGLFAANANGQGVAAALALRVKANGALIYEDIARFDTTQNKYVPIPIDLGEASDQLFLILFGTGMRGRASLAGAAATIGGANVEVLYVGAQGSLVGLDQANVRIPRSLAGRGEVNVVLSVDGLAANVVTVSVK